MEDCSTLVVVGALFLGTKSNFDEKREQRREEKNGIWERELRV
jgi:hypothetical protein